MISLPAPDYANKFELNKALQTRRSLREYADGPLTLAQAGQLLWAGQGVTSLGGYRTAPSAGALYPLELYLVAGNVQDLPAGIYKYHPGKHALSKSSDGDPRSALAEASLAQGWMTNAPAMVVIAAAYERSTVKYGDRGIRYTDMEVGHAAQNIALEAVALGLGAVDVGAFSDGAVRKIMRLPARETPLCILPVGRKK
ncbi:MAG: SagB/ThcOx family dehydrogenase [Verrucomicrobiota bacterium]